MGRTVIGLLAASALAVTGTASAQAAPTDLSVAYTRPSADYGQLDSVSSHDANSAWATGSTGNSGRPLVVHWDGHTWSEVATPNLPDSALTTVLAVGHAEAWAIGTKAPGLPIVAHGRGADWREVPVPLRAEDQPELTGLTEGWLVGTVLRAGHRLPISLRWNGNAWLEVPVPLPAGVVEGALNAVEAHGPHEVWATGSAVTPDPDGTSHSRIFVTRWDGHAWTPVSTPPVPSLPTGGVASGELLTGPWLVGGNTAFRREIYTFEHWNGHAWELGPAAPTEDDGGAAVNIVRGASAGSPGQLWIAAQQLTGSHRSAPRILRWDGTKWVAYPVPAELLAGSGQGWAVAAGHGGPTWVVVNTQSYRGAGSYASYILRAG